MVKLRYSGTWYQGWDSGQDALLKALPGTTVEVSEEKASQLLKDFPGQWETVGERTYETPAVTKRGRPRKMKPAVTKHDK